MSKYIKPPRSEDCHWRRDKPKEPGWYPASFARLPDILRYWNGSYWSEAASDERDADYAARAAKRIYPCQRNILWCEPWWPEKKGKT